MKPLLQDQRRHNNLQHGPWVALVLGIASEELGMPFLASGYYRDAAEGGPTRPTFAPAVCRAGALAERTGNTSDLDAISRRVPADQMPPALRAVLAYRSGRVALQEGRFAEARERLAAVPDGTPYTDRAHYAHAVAAASLGDLASAEALLRSLGDTPDAALQRLSRMGLARLMHRSARYRSAVEIYETLPGAGLEQAWAELLRRRLPEAQAALHGVEGSGAARLRALVALTACDLASAIAIVDAEEPALVWERDALLDGLARTDAPVHAMYAYWERYTAQRLFYDPAVRARIAADPAVERATARARQADEDGVRLLELSLGARATQQARRTLGDWRSRARLRAARTLAQAVRRAVHRVEEDLEQLRIVRSLAESGQCALSGPPDAPISPL